MASRDTNQRGQGSVVRGQGISTQHESAVMARRGVQIFLVAVIGMAFVGFVVGMRQGATAYEPAVIDRTTTPTRTAAIPAMSYEEFDRRRFGPNRAWQSSLADLPQPEQVSPEPIEWTEEAREVLRAARAQRRAFPGAPPTVPHPVDQMTTASCLSCHATGMAIGDTFAPAMSHELLHNCTQCHVEQVSPDLAPSLTARNLFEPFEAPVQGARAWEGAPPSIPHPTSMRQNCLSCHGARGPDPIRTTHPWRSNCMQCHTPSAVLDQAVFQDPDAFLPGPVVEPEGER